MVNDFDRAVELSWEKICASCSDFQANLLVNSSWIDQTPSAYDA